MKIFLSLIMAFSFLVLPIGQINAAVKDNLTEEQKAELDAKSQEAQAQADEAKTKAWEAGTEAAKEAGLEFVDFQTAVLKVLDLAIARVEKAEGTIESLYYMSDVTKDEITDGLGALKGELLSYKTQVNNADTVEEVKAINAKVVQTLKDSTSVIVEAIRESSMVIYEEVQKTVEKLKIKADAILATLSVDCTEGSDDIAALQTQLTSLETVNDNLKAAIEDQDKENAKKYAQEAMNMVPGVVKSLNSVLDTCSQYIE
jgi:hypothetical protein